MKTEKNNKLPAHLRGFASAKSIGQGKFFDEGHFRLAIQLVKHDVKQDTNEPYYLVEFKVVEVYSQPDDVKATKVGETRTWYQGFKWKDSALGAIKAFLKVAYSQLLQEAQKDDDIGDDELMLSYDEEQPLASVELDLQVSMKLKKGEKPGGETRPVYRWSVPEDSPIADDME